MAGFPLRGNWLGVGMFVVGGLVAGVLGFVFKLPDAPAMIGVGITLIVLDFAFRVSNMNMPRWLVSRDAGGFFFFVPIWGLGIFAVILNLLILAGVIKK